MSPLHLYIISVGSLVFGSRIPQTDGRSWTEKRDEDDLLKSLRLERNSRDARNVLLFVGDGMGPNSMTAARIYRGGEESQLVWEGFPYLAALKTYSADKQVPESASTATAMFTGVKNNFEVLGLDTRVKPADCQASLNKDSHLTTLATWAQEAGKSTGFVTTTRVTDATPGALFARSGHRTWECDSALPSNATLCRDIARQLVEESPGNNFNVILGGGAQVLQSEVTSSPENPIDAHCCRRTDGMDLIRLWQLEKAAKQFKYTTVNDTKSLLALNPAEVDYLLGIFSNSHFPYEYQRNKGDHGVPSLEKMTATAVKLLAKNPKGFFLMVEGGMIDKGHHSGRARVALHELLALNEAVNGTLRLLEDLGIMDDTLVIVTSDHSHTLTMSGYPDKGNDIFGIADKSLVDGKPYTTLSYATSGIENFHFVAEGGTVVREDPSTVDTTSFEYHVLSPVVTDMNTHGGSDVFVYATGPQAHLFHSLHENTYIATVIKFAAKLGKFSEDSESIHSSSSKPNYLPRNIQCHFIFVYIALCLTLLRF